MARWHDITRDPEYQDLSPEVKLEVKRGFFDRTIAIDPEFQAMSQEGREATFEEFMSIPDDTGQGYITSMLGAAGRGFGEVVPGVVEGVGALTGIEPIQEAGQDIRAGLEYISPVNPIYAESVPVKLAGVGGQIGSVLATGGIGGAAGRALAAERIAAAGTQAARQAALTQAVQRGAQTALLGTAAAQGAAEGAQQAEQYGMTGPEAYLRTLAGAATEVGTELLPFGMAAETALAKRALASAPRTTGFVGSTLSEGGEEALAQIGSNIATQVLAPAGVETPGITEGALEAGLYGAAGGAMLGGVNALISTPPERQTESQQRAAAEFNARPVDAAPPVDPQENLRNSQDPTSTPVVTPDGAITWLPAVSQAITPTPPVTPPVQTPSQVEQRLAEYMQNPATKTAASLVQNAAQNPDAAEAAKASQAVIENVGASVVSQPAPAPTPITTALEPEPAAELPPPSPLTGQPTVLPVGTVTPTTTPEDAIQEQITDAGVLRQEGPEMELQGVGEGNVQPEEVAGEGEVEAQEEVAQPPAAAVPTEAPQPSPNLPAPVVRDMTKPEQMTPEELLAFEKSQAVASAEEALQRAKKGQEVPNVFLNGFKSKAALVRAREQQLEEARNYSRKPDVWNIVMEAAQAKKPISAALVESFDDRDVVFGVGPAGEPGGVSPSPRKQVMERLQGYVKQGDLYVFQPQPTAAETQTPDSVAVEPEAPAAQPPAAEPVTPEVTTPEAEALVVAETKAQETTNGLTDVQPQIDSVIDGTLSEEEKSAAAKELGATSWNADALKLFKQTLADWSVGAKQVSARLAAIFQKVLDSAKSALLAIGIFIGSGVNTERGITPIQTVTENIPAPNIAQDMAAVESQVRNRLAATPDAQARAAMTPPRTSMAEGLAAAGTLSATGVQLPAVTTTGEVPLVAERQAPLVKRANFNGAAASTDASLMADWIVSTNDNKGKPFIVGDKTNGALFVFDGEGNLVRKTPALFGMNVGDQEPVDTDKERVTPSGRFESTMDYNVDYYGSTLDFHQTEISGFLSIHKVYLKEPEERRQQRIDSKTPADNRITYGCINVDEQIFNSDIAPAFANGGIVYILPETQKGRSAFVPLSLYDSSKVQPVSTAESKAQEKADKKAEKTRSDGSRASLARLVAGERGNPVFGNVTMDDGIEALRQLDAAGDLPNIFFTEITTTQEFFSKPENEQNFPDTWAALSAGGKAEGMEEKGTAFVFIDNVGVTNLDRKLATQFGTTPEVAAVRRVATHESIHKAISFLNESEQIALFRYMRELYSPEQLDVLAETYTNFANWRESKSSYLNLIEESLTRTIDSMDSLPKDGILGEFIQWLKGIWRKITGKKGEPTLNDMKDVMRLIRNGLRNSTKARADRTISGGVVRYSYAGEKAIENLPEERRQFMRDSLDAAKAMAAAGKSSEEIRAATGWFPGKYDGKMRWEVPSSDASWKNDLEFENPFKAGRPSFFEAWSNKRARDYSKQTLPLSDFLNYPALFEAYPEAAGIPVRVLNIKPAKAAYGLDGSITVGDHTTPSEALSSILHEIQHWIQNKEGFSVGGNAEKTGYDDYLRTAGEIEARDVQARQKLTPEQRAATAPYSSENIAPEDAIVMFGGGGAQMSMATPATDAEYLAAVEAGDMEKAQRMVDAAAKRAGYNVSGVGNGITYEAGDEPDSVYGERDNVMSHGGAFGFYFSDNPTVWSDYAKPRRKGEKGRVNRTLLSLKNPFRFSKEFVSYDDLQALLRDGGIALPAEVKSRLDRLVAGGFGDTQPVWKWLHPTHVGAGASYGESLKKSFTDAGYDGVIHPDSSLMEGGLDTPATSYVVFSPSQIKSADPVTRDDQGRIIPPSQRFQTTSPDIRFSLPTLVSESASAFSSGQQAARAISFTPRQLDVYMAVLGAFSTLRRKGKQSATMQELFDAANTLVSGITPNEFSETLQGLYNDNAALLNPGDSTFQVFNRDGELAGAVVLVAKDTSRASLIPPEEVKGITDKLTSDMDKAVTEGEQSPFEGLSFTGNVPKMHARVNFRNVEKAAEDFVNQMIRSRKEKGRTYIEALIDIADMVATDNFAKEYIGGAGMESQGLVLQAIPPPLNNKIYAAQMTNISEADRVRLEDAYRKVSLYYEGIGTVGGTLQGYRAWTATRGKYGWLLDSWKADALKTAEYAVNAQMGGSVSVKINQDLNDAVTGVGKAVADEVSGIVEEDQDAIELAAGEATLDEENKSLWNRVKDWLREIGAAMNHIKSMGGSSRASLTAAQRSDISKMSREEALAFIEDRQKKINKALKTLLGEESDAKTPEQQATREKRKKMVDTAQKRVDKGNDIDVAKDEEPESSEEQVSKAERTAQAILKDLSERYADPMLLSEKESKINEMRELYKQRVRQGVGPEQMTEAYFVNKAKELGADETTAGILWKAAELEIDARETMRQDKILQRKAAVGERADAQAHRIIFATERLKRQSGFSGIDTNPKKDTIIQAFRDQVKNPVSIENFIVRLQGLNVSKDVANRLFKAAEREKIDLEAMAQWRANERLISKRLDAEVSDIVAEQADNPVSIEEFAKKLSQFNLTPKQVKRYFDIAARAAVRRVEINNEKAKRIIYERGDIRPDVAEKDVDGDTVIEAFRDQVNSPTEEQAFLERLSKLGVAENVAKDLFNTAARERRDRQRTRVFDMIEGKNAIQRMLREIALARRGIEMPLRNPIPWTELLSKPAKSVDEYRQRVLDGILANPDMESVDNDVKERIADMFTDLWQEQVDKAVNRVIDNYTLQLDRAQRRQAGEALNKSRSKVIQHLNLGVLSNDAFIRILGEKFGIKMDMTKEERKHIESLLATLQDESLPKNKRNQASDDLASALMQYTKVGWSARLSLFWAMSVLAGWNTMLAIGMSFMNGANIILVRTPIGILSKMVQGDFKGALDVTFDSLNDMKRYLEAFPEAVDRAWGYITSGKVDLLEAEAAAPDRLFKSWDSLAKYRKVADQMVQDPKMLVRWMGTFMRMIGRIMTALDGFNTIVTKRGHLSMAVRLVAPDKEAFDRIIAKGSIEHYRQMLLASDPYFANMTPEKRRLLNSTAEAMMYQAMNEEGAKLENADFYASESAFTMDPSGLGGMIYGAIKKAEETSKSFAERNLAEKRLEAQGADRLSLENAKLATAYITHFLAYNAVNYVGLRFARFAANKFNQGLSFIPFLGMTRFWEKSNSKLVDRQEAFTEMIYRNQAVGAVFAILGVMLIRALDEEPDDEKRGWFINGGLENVPTAQRRQLQEGGKLQYRLGVKINGRWLVFSYQNWPWSQLFSALGSTSDMIRFSPEKWREKGTSDILLSVAASGLTSTLDLPALQGLGTVLGRSISSSDPAEDFWTNIGAASANWVGGFIPKPLMDLDYILDSNRRKYTTIWEKTAGVVPFYRRYVGEDYFNILGDPIKRNALPGSREFLLGPTEPAYKILGALNSRDIWLTPANAEQRMVGKGRNRRRLTQQEADAYSLETGKAYKTMILRYGPRALKMSPERARAFLSDKADEVRDRVLMKVYRGYRSRPSAQ